MDLEKELADYTLKAIEIKDEKNADKFYNQYLFYTRKVLKEFDKDLQNKVMYKYGFAH